jgi:hypothetical protein
VSKSRTTRVLSSSCTRKAEISRITAYLSFLTNMGGRLEIDLLPIITLNYIIFPIKSDDFISTIISTAGIINHTK